VTIKGRPERHFACTFVVVVAGGQVVLSRQYHVPCHPEYRTKLTTHREGRAATVFPDEDRSATGLMNSHIRTLGESAPTTRERALAPEAGPWSMGDPVQS